MKEIYLLSGLGADKRVFEFLDLSDFKVNHVDWVEPMDKESIESYAQRLLNHNDRQSNNNWRFIWRYNDN
jgi:hypothetical protein